jgi:hypothetical protein
VKATGKRVVKPRQPKAATQYHWPTVYAIIRASSDQAVQRALERFGVKETK